MQKALREKILQRVKEEKVQFDKLYGEAPEESKRTTFKSKYLRKDSTSADFLNEVKDTVHLDKLKKVVRSTLKD